MKRRFVTTEMVDEMKRMEAEGRSRKEIAEQMDLDAATVTRHLGAIRQYRGSRIPATSC
jgi:DNA-binding CsgD family transcriptional regulator